MATWALVAGDKAHGRADVLAGVVRRLQAEGAVVGGFLQVKATDAEERPTIELVHLGDGSRETLAVSGVSPRGAGEEGYCTFAFRTEAFLRARAWIEGDVGACDAIVLDGIGALEAGSGGHAVALERALAAGRPRLVLLGVQARRMALVLERFYPGDPAAALELPASDGELQAFTAEVVRLVG